MSEKFIGPGTLEDKIMVHDEHTLRCDRVFPMGPECDFEGNMVQCFVACTKNRSITKHNLLAAMLAAMYLSGVFSRGRC
jgi:hypothetical protein